MNRTYNKVKLMASYISTASVQYMTLQSMFYTLFYNNLTFIPVRAISETLNYTVLWDEFYLTVKITAPDVIVPEACKDYSYTYEDIMSTISLLCSISSIIFLGIFKFQSPLTFISPNLRNKQFFKGFNCISICHS